MNTLNNSKFFETQTRNEIATILEKKEPFRNTAKHIFGTADNIMASAYYGSAHLRIGMHASFLEKCHEATQDSIKQDEVVTTSALMAKLEAQELENAYLRQQAGVANATQTA